ncbi:MAG: GNAT family N-acetyltransferase [Myxococcota bacterium]
MSAPLQFELVEVTDRAGNVVHANWLARAETVHRQLRPQMPADYAAKMGRVFAGGGRMLIAHAGEEVVGVAVWRSTENTFSGRYLYVDDLVTDAARRSCGVGKALLDHCERIARELDCDDFVLDSGVQRAQAHKFYFREGLTIKAFNFNKRLRS